MKNGLILSFVLAAAWAGPASAAESLPCAAELERFCKDAGPDAGAR